MRRAHWCWPTSLSASERLVLRQIPPSLIVVAVAVLIASLLVGVSEAAALFERIHAAAFGCFDYRLLAVSAAAVAAVAAAAAAAPAPVEHDRRAQPTPILPSFRFNLLLVSPTPPAAVVVAVAVVFADSKNDRAHFIEGA